MTDQELLAYEREHHGDPYTRPCSSACPDFRARFDNDPRFIGVSRAKRGNFGLAGERLQAWKARASVRTPGSAETAEQRRQPWRTVCTG
jgi:hypothetical protein